MQRVQVQPDDALTAGYLQAAPVRVRISLNDGRELVREQHDYEGARTRPLDWGRVVEKFHWLAEPYADGPLRERIITAVADLDGIEVSALTGLLAQVSPTPQHPRTRRL